LVAAAMGIPVHKIEVTVNGSMDLQGTLGMSKTVPVGFQSMSIEFKIDAPEASSEQLKALQEKTEQYCVVLQTMLHPPNIEARWNASSTG